MSLLTSFSITRWGCCCGCCCANIVDCPACESNNSKFLYKKYYLSHLLCKNCFTQYVSPRPTKALLEDFFTVKRNDWGVSLKDLPNNHPKKTATGSRCLIESKLLITKGK